MGKTRSLEKDLSYLARQKQGGSAFMAAATSDAGGSLRRHTSAHRSSSSSSFSTNNDSCCCRGSSDSDCDTPHATSDFPVANHTNITGSRFDVLTSGTLSGGTVRRATKMCQQGIAKPHSKENIAESSSYSDVARAAAAAGGGEAFSMLDMSPSSSPCRPGEGAQGGAAAGEPCNIPSNPPFKRLQAQPFSHILVCDFEATCEGGSVSYPHEIIEFPVVVIDTATLKVVAQFHSYVRPVRNPRLTKFCTELTGITQEMVDASDPIDVVVTRFGGWLREVVYPLCREWRARYGAEKLSTHLKSEQKRFVFDESTEESRGFIGEEKMICFATDGPWDMRHFMHICSVLRDNVEFPPLFYRYINVRHCYTDLLKTRQVKLTHMLKKLRMSFEGQRHSGIDDTRNIARVLAELLARGYRVGHVSTIKYCHRGDAFLEHNKTAQELLAEYGEEDEKRTTRRTRNNTNTNNKSGNSSKGKKEGRRDFTRAVM